ncbi:MAG: response regulator [Deltaproteobacteria bacterium]|nr:response regulator [Deltaproteobacteria bacterium]
MACVLIIDDEPSLRFAVRRVLERAGHTTVEAGDGGEGLKVLGLQPVDVVITDIIMPNVEGIELIRNLHRSRPELPVVAMSGGGRLSPEGYLKLAKTFGASQVLKKPFEADELLAAVNATLKPPGPTA